MRVPRRASGSARRERRDAIHGDLVVAIDGDFLSELGEVLHQVEGERIVVIDHQHHGAAYADSLCASAAARSSARALCCVSSHSDFGSESATTPAAACTCSLPALTTAVRMAMAMSMS